MVDVTDRSIYPRPLTVCRGIGGGQRSPKAKHLSLLLNSHHLPTTLFLRWLNNAFSWMETSSFDIFPSLAFKFSKRNKTFFPEITAWFQINGFSVSDHIITMRRFSASQIIAFHLPPDSLAWVWVLTIGVSKYVLIIFMGLHLW